MGLKVVLTFCTSLAMESGTIRIHIDYGSLSTHNLRLDFTHPMHYKPQNHIVLCYLLRVQTRRVQIELRKRQQGWRLISENYLQARLCLFT